MAISKYKLTPNGKKQYKALMKDLVDLANTALIAMDSNNDMLLQDTNFEMNKKYERINLMNLKAIRYIQEGVQVSYCK